MSRLFAIAAAAAVFALSGARLSFSTDLPDGLSGRLIVGYQGWFGCPNDFESNDVWQHWFLQHLRPGCMTVDLLPSVHAFKTTDLCDTGLPSADGQETVKLYSAQNASVVNTHFNWMRDYGIDGAAVQRFVSELSDPKMRSRRDNVLENVKSAAEAYGRIFFVTYDVSGANPQTVIDDVRADWHHLVNDLRITDSPAYLQDNGKPVLQLWGFGFRDRPGEAAEVGTLIKDLKAGNAGLPAVTLMGGVPARWRTLGDDSKRDPAWATVYRSYDVISPWSVGRFGDDAGADAFLRNVIEPDLIETRRLGLRYMPVAFPGFSWSNLMRIRGQAQQAIFNQIPRNCGRFLWRQFSNSLTARADAVYVAMFDEVDEGTAIFPVETRQDKLPARTRMVYLNIDGCSLPDDWYLRVTGSAAKFLREGQVPPRDLSAVVTP